MDGIPSENYTGDSVRAGPIQIKGTLSTNDEEDGLKLLKPISVRVFPLVYTALVNMEENVYSLATTWQINPIHHSWAISIMYKRSPSSIESVFCVRAYQKRSQDDKDEI